MRRLRCARFVLLLCLPPDSAFSSLILEGAVPMGGIGAGAVPTVLTIQRPGGSETESGCVAWNGLIDVIGSPACGSTGAVGGNELTGASQTLTRTLLETQIRSAADLRIVFSPREPAGGSVLLTDLTVMIFDRGGEVLFTSSPLETAVVLPETSSQGPIGFVFKLDSGDTVVVPNNAFANPYNRIGLTATAAGVGGGPERFFVGSADYIDPPATNETPEPATVLTAGCAVAAVLLLRSRRRSIMKSDLADWRS